MHTRCRRMGRVLARLFTAALAVSLVTVPCQAAGAAHITGDEVLALAQEARSALRAQDWGRAAELYAGVVAASPDDGLQWDGYGSALLHLGRLDDARRAYGNCVRVGFRIPVSYYNMACASSRAGRIEEALADLERAYDAGYVDERLVRSDADLDPLRGDPRFRELTGVPDPTVTDRVERWRHDLAYLLRRLEQVHYSLYANVRAEDLRTSVAAIESSVATMDDVHVRYEIQRILTRIGDGHTTIGLPHFQRMHGLIPGGRPAGDGAPLVLPIDLVWFDEGVYVRAAAPALEGRILGRRVVAIGSVPMDEVLRRVDAIVSRDNAWGARWMAMEFLRTPGALQALDLTDRPDGAAFTIQGPDATQEVVSVAAAPAEILDALVVAPGSSVAARPDGSGTDAPYSFSLLADPPLAWVRIDRMADAHEESLAEFTARLMRSVDEKGIESMAIDLRRNHGGNGTLTQPLLRALIGSERINRPGHLFVLVSRETFSAAMAFAADLDLHTAALFVGEPTGSRPNFVGESSIFILPYSQLAISCSSRFHQNGHATDTRYWIPPDLPVDRSPAELTSREDEGRNAILRWIAAERR